MEAAPEWYGLPKREYGSVLIGSFNIRKLGSARSRNSDTWEFLADVCRSFDLLAVQEIMDNLSGLRRLMSLLGPEFSMVVSDQTGVFPGEPGVGERLGFIYRWNTVERMEVASDVTYDQLVQPTRPFLQQPATNAFFGWGSGRHDPEKGWQDKESVAIALGQIDLVRECRGAGANRRPGDNSFLDGSGGGSPVGDCVQRELGYDHQGHRSGQHNP